MDEVLEAMQQFLRKLEHFNENLRSSFGDLEKYHHLADPHWQDSMRAEYDKYWLRLNEGMKEYVASKGTGYADILKEKSELLINYLHGS